MFKIPDLSVYLHGCLQPFHKRIQIAFETQYPIKTNDNEFVIGMEKGIENPHVNAKISQCSVHRAQFNGFERTTLECRITPLLRLFRASFLETFHI